MGPLSYAVVAYIRNHPLASFVEELRAELRPTHSHLPAHVTVLPPRPLHGSEGETIARLETLCRAVAPFDVTMGEVESFIPTTPTVFIRVAHAAYKLRELHDLLNENSLRSEEQWPYMPHVTIVKVDTQAEADEALEISRQRWMRYEGPRRITIERLTFVRSAGADRWTDLAPVPLLGAGLVSTR